MEPLSRDVLPAGARRRLRRRDGMLPAVLMCELLAGMALGAVWPALTAAPPPVPQGAMTAVTVPTVPVGHPPAPAPAPGAPSGEVTVPVPVHSPRNPFGAPAGVDTTQQLPAAPVVPVAPVVPLAPVVPAPVSVPVAPVPGVPFPPSAPLVPVPVDAGPPPPPPAPPGSGAPPPGS